MNYKLIFFELAMILSMIGVSVISEFMGSNASLVAIIILVTVSIVGLAIIL